MSVIVPAYNGADQLDRCLQGVVEAMGPDMECLVVDDASPDPHVAATARRHGVRYHRRSRQGGPAAARNRGVELTGGDILFFTDADVVLHPDAISQAVTALDRDSDLAAVFGSYDARPEARGLLSRYRNLYHHWNHQRGQTEASTFWTGCGAMRRAVFVEAGGFDTGFEQPSVEDIELGYRLRRAGHRIRLLKSMQGTHLKRWRFADMIRTDILRRGAPWFALLLGDRAAPADLNLNRRARIATIAAALLPIVGVGLILSGHAGALLPTLALLPSALCGALLRDSRDSPGAPGPQRAVRSIAAGILGVLPPLLALAWVADPWALAPLALIAIIVAMQWDFYRLLTERGGAGFAIAAVPLQVVFFGCCALAVPLGWLAWRRAR